jgi:hypothetical protein
MTEACQEGRMKFFCPISHYIERVSRVYLPELKASEFEVFS